jgi:hypothetical protein
MNMPKCKFGFVYKGMDLCALEKKCPIQNPSEYHTCEVVHRLFFKLSPENIERLKQQVISKQDHPPKNSNLL